MILSVVPVRRIRDPRQLLFWCPSMTAQRYAQLVAEFHHDQMLRLAENLANGLGFLLIPASCLNWKVIAKISAERKVLVGRNAYFMLKKSELSKRAYEKFLLYVQEVQSENQEEDLEVG